MLVPEKKVVEMAQVVKAASGIRTMIEFLQRARSFRMAGATPAGQFDTSECVAFTDEEREQLVLCVQGIATGRYAAAGIEPSSP